MDSLVLGSKVQLFLTEAVEGSIIKIGQFGKQFFYWDLNL